MKVIDPGDDETPVEETPGYIGMTMDHEFYPRQESRCLEKVNWDRYHQLLEYAPTGHTFEVAFHKGRRQIRFDCGKSIRTPIG
jgi:hypothetical protein